MNQLYLKEFWKVISAVTWRYGSPTDSLTVLNYVVSLTKSEKNTRLEIFQKWLPFFWPNNAHTQLPTTVSVVVMVRSNVITPEIEKCVKSH